MKIFPRKENIIFTDNGAEYDFHDSRTSLMVTKNGKKTLYHLNDYNVILPPCVLVEVTTEWIENKLNDMLIAHASQYQKDRRRPDPFLGAGIVGSYTSTYIDCEVFAMYANTIGVDDRSSTVTISYVNDTPDFLNISFYGPNYSRDIYYHVTRKHPHHATGRSYRVKREKFDSIIGHYFACFGEVLALKRLVE